MNNLIQISEREIDGSNIQTVNARELHSFLEVGKDFSNWIKDRIDQYSFVANQDYVVYAKTGENLSGGRPQKEYAISLDMAKEMSMVERNEKCKEALQYFIECERRAKSNATDPMKALSDPTIMRSLLLTYTEKVITLENKVLEQTSKVKAFDRIAGADGLVNLQAAGKILQQRPNKFIQKLREIRWIFKRPGAKDNSAYIDKINEAGEFLAIE
ncbi:MAG: antA/AntB antirepressor family protein [Nitrosomonas sp.]|nr:antA/AntB antirepressor family protein [Nitrosomonas sp.]